MSHDPLELKRIHHVEFWVGNAKQASFYYRNAFGFSQFAYSGLETGRRDATSYALKQHNARFVLTTPLGSGKTGFEEAGSSSNGTKGLMNEFLQRHGDGVRDIAFEVADTDAAYAAALERGATGVVEPHDLTDEHGTLRHAAIQTYGDTLHSLISNKDYKGPFMPGYEAREIPSEDAGLRLVDHIVGNVELGKMNHWADWYSKVLGFERYITFDDKDISTEYSALMSIVMTDDSQKVKFPINEPAAGRKKSQIEEYLDYNDGAGVQHVALLTGDIIKSVKRLRSAGIDFLRVPQSYYEELPERIGEIDEDLEALAELGILVDRDDEGYLLQLFTKPVEDRPTVFFEIIQRKGSRGFGKGNFKALFESIEREQAVRGNL